MLKRMCLLLFACTVACVLVSGCFLFPNHAPVADFSTHYNVDLEDPMVVVLDASLSTDPDGDLITQYMWVFSDDLELEPLAYSATVDHSETRVRCPNEGEYSIQLLVLDEHNLASTPVTKTVVVPQPL